MLPGQGDISRCELSMHSANVLYLIICPINRILVRRRCWVDS